MTSTIRFVPISSDDATASRDGAPDAYGLVAERRISPGGYPC
ncbi:hypothetical protein [Rhizobium sp. AQ_MP]|nr:hypothetical protein [Rhizobium sp. AQ_MP]